MRRNAIEIKGSLYKNQKYKCTEKPVDIPREMAHVFLQHLIGPWPGITEAPPCQLCSGVSSAISEFRIVNPPAGQIYFQVIL